MVRNNFMMHLCTVATLCFLEKTFPRNYYYSDQDDNSLSLCFKSMYLTLFVAIFTSNFIFSMSKSFHTYRNINIRNLMIKTSYDQDILWTRHFLKSCLQLSYDRLLMIKTSYDQDKFWRAVLNYLMIDYNWIHQYVESDILWSSHLMIKTPYDQDILWSRHYHLLFFRYTSISSGLISK